MNEERTILDTWHHAGERWIPIRQIVIDDVLYLYTSGKLVRKTTAEELPWHAAFFKDIISNTRNQYE